MQMSGSEGQQQSCAQGLEPELQALVLVPELVLHGDCCRRPHCHPKLVCTFPSLSGPFLSLKKGLVLEQEHFLEQVLAALALRRLVSLPVVLAELPQVLVQLRSYDSGLTPAPAIGSRCSTIQVPNLYPAVLPSLYSSPPCHRMPGRLCLSPRTPRWKLPSTFSGVETACRTPPPPARAPPCPGAHLHLTLMT
jgi:hypothetical protein